ncbi:helix-turn-helix domain-containing protein [Brevibacillus laterosporus]|uniref:helix-turn-helix domain-containing protein n=1 Tax=Brevibacillus laterosporus TaxID=1465 RepID=UPI003D1CBB65
MNYTFGHIIKKFRESKGLSISEVENAVNITHLRRLENGRIEHPKLQTLEKVVNFLGIPWEEIAEPYALKQANRETIISIVKKVLPVITQDSLYNITHHFIVISSSIQSGIDDLAMYADSLEKGKEASKLYSVLSKHALNYHKNDLLANFLLSEYLIRRDGDFTGSYYLGKRVIDHAHLLITEKKVLAYYKVGVHASLLKDYTYSNDCLKKIVEDDSLISSFKEKAYHAYYNNLINVERIEEGEKYLEEYALKFNKYKSSNYIIDKASIHSKRGNIGEAILMLEEYLRKFKEDHDTIVAVNLLLELYMKSNKFDQARELYRYEELFKRMTHENDLRGPFNKNTYGLYLRLKGRLEYLVGNFKGAVESILLSMETFSTMGFKDEFIEGLDVLYTFNRTQLIGKFSSGKPLIDVNVQLGISECLKKLIKTREKEITHEKVFNGVYDDGFVCCTPIYSI